MVDDGHGGLEMRIREIRVDAGEAGYATVTLGTSRGDVVGRWYRADDARVAAIWVGGVGGGWDSPARGLYPRLCEALVDEGISSLRVRFRHPGELAASTLDVLAGLELLRLEGVEAAGLVGHSFGGAVVIRAAAVSDRVRTVVTLSTQSGGTEPVAALGPRCSILLLHGGADPVLPAACSRSVHARAREPKRLVIFDGVDHVLDPVADEVAREVRTWLLQELRPGAEPGGRPG